MTPQELKSSILQLAIQGKLVEQRSEEGSACNLKKELLTKKAEWISSGRILKKSETKPFFDNEDLFVIPDTWEWVQLSDVSIIQEGAGIRKWQYRDFGTQILCVTNILDGNIDLEKKQLYISTEEYIEKYKHLTLEKGDIVTSCSGGSWGKIAFFNSDDTLMLNTSTLRMRFFGDLADNSYLYYVCKSPFFKRQLELQLSGMQPNFGYAHYSRILFPLPPLAEQKRIVAKIEELLPLIDRYEQAWSKLEEFNKRFPVDMQKSILQIAIQGKLVPQLPEEGTGEELFQQIQTEKQALIKAGKIKKEKPLPEITEDEIPFDIPESWKWVYIGDLFQHNTGKALNSSDKSGNPMEYITTSNVYWNSFTLDKLKTMLFTETEVDKCTVQKGDLLVLEGGDVGRAAIWNYDFPMRIQNHIHRLRPYGNLSIKYFYHVFYLYKNAGMINGKGIGIKGLSSGTLHSLLVPLPPLAEQKRIVAKLEEILPLCERLK